MLIAYQLTDASNLAFTWIQLGLLAASVRIIKGDSSRLQMFCTVCLTETNAKRQRLFSFQAVVRRF